MEKDNKKCRVENCFNYRESNLSLCSMHRSRWKKYKSFDLPERKKLPIGVIRICKIHGELKKDDVYNNGFTKGSKPQYVCKKCKQVHLKRWSSLNREKIRSRQPKYDRNRVKYGKSNEPVSYFKRRLKIKYGITLEQYEGMILSQKNKCLICNKTPEEIELNSKKIRILCIDHCHKTGIVRGLLCFKCNGMLGMAEDSITLLQNAIEYLLKFNRVVELKNRLNVSS